MSVNSSSSFTVVSSSLSSSNSSINSFYEACQQSTSSNVIYTLYTFIDVLLLLPLYILILYMGFQQGRRQRSIPAGTTMSHTDFFTYHMIIVEMLGVFGSVVYTLSIYLHNKIMLGLGAVSFCIIFPGQSLFHLLTCLERYLAVVHPITYMRLRETCGVRIRNISTVVSWLLCFGWVGVTVLYWPSFPTVPFLSFFGVSVSVIFFCCLSVLHVLTRPGPGEAGQHKAQVDQSKQRALHMITVIMGVLVVRFVGFLVSCGMEHVASIDMKDMCMLMIIATLLTVPSSLVLPLLFLHRAGKLSWCRKRTESG